MFCWFFNGFHVGKYTIDFFPYIDIIDPTGRDPPSYESLQGEWMQKAFEISSMILQHEDQETNLKHIFLYTYVL